MGNENSRTKPNPNYKSSKQSKRTNARLMHLENQQVPLEGTQNGISWPEYASVPSEHKLELVKNQLENVYPSFGGTERNVLLFGRAGTGKSSAIEMIKDICAMPKGSLFNNKSDARIQLLHLRNKSDNALYSLRMIDTPGSTFSGNEEQHLLEIVQFCLFNQIRNIHAVMIFISSLDKISDAEKHTSKMYFDLFKTKQIPIALCITKTERLINTECEKILDDLKQDDLYSQLINQSHVKVLFFGMVNDAYIREISDDLTLINAYKRVHKKREICLQWLFCCTFSTSVFDLSVSLNMRRSIATVIDSIINDIDNLKHHAEDRHDIMNTVLCNLEYLRKYSVMIENSVFLRERFEKMKLAILSHNSLGGDDPIWKKIPTFVRLTPWVNESVLELVSNENRLKKD